MITFPCSIGTRTAKTPAMVMRIGYIKNHSISIMLMELMILITILSRPFEICTTSKSVIATFGSGAHFYVVGPMRVHPCNRLRAVNRMIIISIHVHEMKTKLRKTNATYKSTHIRRSSTNTFCILKYAFLKKDKSTCSPNSCSGVKNSLVQHLLSYQIQ